MDKNKGGRPTFKPEAKDREIVKVMAGHNIAQEKIATALNITEKTLRKHFKKELATAAAQVEAQLVANLFALAKGKDGTAFRANEFLLNCRFGWSRYAPPPAQPREPELGKKEQLNRAAQTGHEDTGWGNDIRH
jgi:hypothetical protein